METTFPTIVQCSIIDPSIVIKRNTFVKRFVDIGIYIQDNNRADDNIQSNGNEEILDM